MGRRRAKISIPNQNKGVSNEWVYDASARLDRENEWDRIEKERLAEIASRDYSNSKVCKGWEDLIGLENDDWKVEVNLKSGNGSIERKNRTEDMSFGETYHYLSTHTFYGKSYKDYEGMLRKCGFDVQLITWDKEESE